MNSKIADVLILCTAMLGGSTFVTSKIILDSIPPMYLLSIRFIISFLVLSAILRKKLLPIQRNDLIRGILLGTVLFMSLASQTIGLQFTSASKQAFITGAYVVVVPFIHGIYAHKRLKFADIFNACFCFIGIGLLTLGGGIDLKIGDFLSLVSAIFLALQIVMNSYFVKKTDVRLLASLQFGVAGFETLISALLFEKAPMMIQVDVAIALLYLALFATCLGYLIQMFAQKIMNPERVSIILSSETFFGCLFAIIILKETLSASMIAGGVIIILSILINNIRR